MKYNTTRSKIINGEYGRHIQKMIEYAVGIKDRNLRVEQANAIVRAMSVFVPGSKDTEDYWHKLWDNLFIMSDYQLDVDSPFPMPEREDAKERVRRLEYPKHNIRFRPYGYLIENIIDTIATEEDSPEKEQAIVNVANHLKKQYLNWNRDSVNDELIVEHLNELSYGKLALKENFRFSATQDILNDISSSNAKNASAAANGSKNKKKKKKNNGGNGQANAQANAQKNNLPKNNLPKNENNPQKGKNNPQKNKNS